MNNNGTIGLLLGTVLLIGLAVTFTIENSIKIYDLEKRVEKLEDNPLNKIDDIFKPGE